MPRGGKKSLRGGKKISRALRARWTVYFFPPLGNFSCTPLQRNIRIITCILCQSTRYSLIVIFSLIVSLIDFFKKSFKNQRNSSSKAREKTLKSDLVVQLDIIRYLLNNEY